MKAPRLLNHQWAAKVQDKSPLHLVLQGKSPFWVSTKPIVYTVQTGTNKNISAPDR